MLQEDVGYIEKVSSSVWELQSIRTMVDGHNCSGFLVKRLLPSWCVRMTLRETDESGGEQGGGHDGHPGGALKSTLTSFKID